MSDKEKMRRTVDPAAEELMAKACECDIGTVYDRHDEQGKRCAFGTQGLCCRICEMGPCRINAKGGKRERGVCGATAPTIVARHLIRQVAAGAAAHSDHGHDIARTLLLTAKGEAKGFSIKSPEHLIQLAKEWGIDVQDKSTEQVAEALAEKTLAQFGQQDGTEARSGPPGHGCQCADCVRLMLGHCIHMTGVAIACPCS